jgi:hypothetical protein
MRNIKNPNYGREVNELGTIIKKEIKKSEKLELEIMAIQLWWQSFGKTGLSEEKHRLYMTEKLVTLKEELDNIQNRKQSWS